jgi:hypothetical protein
LGALDEPGLHDAIEELRQPAAGDDQRVGEVGHAHPLLVAVAHLVENLVPGQRRQAGLGERHAGLVVEVQHCVDGFDSVPELAGAVHGAVSIAVRHRGPPPPTSPLPWRPGCASSASTTATDPGPTATTRTAPAEATAFGAIAELGREVYATVS